MDKYYNPLKANAGAKLQKIFHMMLNSTVKFLLINC